MRRSSSLWRQTRQRKQYKRIWDATNNGLYALTLIKTRNDNSLELNTDDNRIQENIENCLQLIDSLIDTAEDPAQGSITELQLIDDLNLTESQLTTTYQQLKISQETLQAPENTEGKETLRKIEKYAQRKAKR